MKRRWSSPASDACRSGSSEQIPRGAQSAGQLRVGVHRTAPLATPHDAARPSMMLRPELVGVMAVSLSPALA